MLDRRVFILPFVVSIAIILYLVFSRNSENFRKKNFLSKKAVKTISIPRAYKITNNTLKLSVQSDNLARNVKRSALGLYIKQLRSRLPAAKKKVESILDKEGLLNFRIGKPVLTKSPINITFDTDPIILLKAISKMQTKKGEYPVFDTKMENQDDGHGHDSPDTELNRFLEMMGSSEEISDEDIAKNGGMINTFAMISAEETIRAIFRLSIPDTVWVNGTKSSPRVSKPYSRKWKKVQILNDSEYEALGDDFFGITAIGDSNLHRGNRYLIAGRDDRDSLINVKRADNLAFGRDSKIYRNKDCRPGGFTSNRYFSYTEYGQGAVIGFWGSKTYVAIPYRCDSNPEYTTNIEIRAENDSATLVNIEKRVIDIEGRIINRNGQLPGIFNWIAYDKYSQAIYVPISNDGVETSGLDVYTIVKITDRFDFRKVNTVQFTNIDLTPTSYEIEAACFGEDGLLYGITNRTFNQGILQFQPALMGNNWLLKLRNKISLDVNDKLVGITQVTDPYRIPIANVCNLVVMERNEDYFTQDNITLHQVIPAEALIGCQHNSRNDMLCSGFNESSEASEWNELLQEGSCGLGVFLYNGQRLLNYTWTNRDQAITLDHPALAGFKRYLIDIDFNNDIDLSKVEIYDNQCLSANWFNKSSGEPQTVKAMCMGYSIYFRSRLITPDGTGVYGDMINTLIHELAHTRQFVQLGESHYQFGCAYGEQVLFSLLETGSSYSFVPMEVEARRFTDRHRINGSIAMRYGMPVTPAPGRTGLFTPRPTRTTCDP